MTYINPTWVWETLRVLQEQDDASSSTPNRNTHSTHNRGRTVLTVLYLCVLGMCFVVPVFYYIRMHCEERRARRLHNLELAGISQAMEQSQQLHREESRAARRKYREERRARILQLLAPVRMILKLHHFPHLRNSNDNNDSNEPEEEPSSKETVKALAETNNDHNDEKDQPPGDIEQGQAATTTTPTTTTTLQARILQFASRQVSSILTDDEDENICIEIPPPGLPSPTPPHATTTKTTTPTTEEPQTRLVPNSCTICLSHYHIGSDIVYSSNPACEHVFHASCMEQWLMKQREGPLCPCCRRDFVLDPYDLEDDDNEEDEIIHRGMPMSLYVGMNEDNETTTTAARSHVRIMGSGRQVVVIMDSSDDDDDDNENGGVAVVMDEVPSSNSTASEEQV